MSNKWDNDPMVQRLREYLKIPSVHPNIDYTDCVKFIKKQASSLGLPAKVYEFVEKKPVVVITWEGTQPDLHSILLNSHMDVVAVSEEHWTYPPFSAHVTEDGLIYARGSQDMKSVGMIHLEAVRNLKDEGVKLKRTVHISFVPDEETGGEDGMKMFTKSTVFDDMNIGFELDESINSPTPDEFIIFYGERTSRKLTVTCRGIPSHGSLLPSGTAGEKIHFMIDKFMNLRAQEKNKVDAGAPLGEVITVNLTQLRGGLQINIVPEELSVGFDIRLPPNIDDKDFDDMINKWSAEAGEGVTLEYETKNPAVKCTKLENNPFWDAMVNAIDSMGMKINNSICPGSTDASFVRRRGIPAINFTPFVNTPILLHAHNEHIPITEYKKGINVMTKVLGAIANC